MKKRLNIFTIFLLSFLLAGCAPSRNTALQTQATTNEASADNSIIDVESTVDEDDKGSPPSESSEAPAVPQAENVETGVTPAPEKPAEEPGATELEKGSQDRGGGKNSAGTQEDGYILNTNTRKFHRESCSSVSQMQEENKEYSGLTPQELEAQGYKPCGNCNP